MPIFTGSKVSQPSWHGLFARVAPSANFPGFCFDCAHNSWRSNAKQHPTLKCECVVLKNLTREQLEAEVTRLTALNRSLILPPLSADRMLEEAQERYRLAANSTNDAIWESQDMRVLSGKQFPGRGVPVRNET